MRKANELFVISSTAFKACIPQDNNEVPGIISDLVEFGIFNLPYDRVDVRVMDGAGKIYVEVHELRLIRQLSVDEAKKLFEAGPTTAFSAGTVVVGADRYPKLSQSGWHPYSAPWTETARDCAISEIVAMHLIMALSASNVEKIVRSNKRSALGIGKARNRQYARITYVDIPKEKTTKKQPTGRTVRAHLRRGHPRQQHFGPDNLQTKRIWIAPVFVNLDEDYAERAEYRVA